eukprot:CAMPEP_0113325502 /NCGR_PEP_ID=MMETSP0010_2-20120614/17820_1 /TAXON_ID=216773 ORGANISM="Corethron hystrix, Strain 308" /NCGR_SAMPLE_ID=MMETSP0010_2 /ASSEMBLY_ACC=CAM_ASM_000155 /LENGTH=205 /DNA_ID=CAMNT_0000185367 /DNA_START=34 /DNA_END=651 /DNA_ORIENTATION=- /assembly_acc=CAM_ASM_000155
MASKSLIMASLVASAAAFAPVSQTASSTALKAFENEIGAQPPLGFFDPLGLLDDADQERFDRLRYVEVKHGRICMLAIVGHIVTAAGIRCGGDIALGVPFTDMKAGLGFFDTISGGGLAQIIAFIGALELGFGLRQAEIEEACERYQENFPISSVVPFDIDRVSGIELNNGRAAQMGILALMVHEKLDNNPYIINDLLGSPVPFN